ncbi:MAG: hypothetical protein ACOYOA_16615, partial [Saprospiraceae bacterium]
MKKLLHSSLYCLFLICFSSCIVTNNLYVNDPTPLGKNKSKGYLGIGTGTWLLGDSTLVINDNPAKFIIFPVAEFGFKYGVGTKTNLHFSAHTPITFGGLGLKLGMQQSVFENSSPFNLAFGFDVGGALPGSKILGISVNENENRGAFNADFFMPLSMKINSNVKVILTPRYSFNTYYLVKKNKINFTVLSAGLSYKRNLFEASALFNNSHFLPR